MYQTSFLGKLDANGMELNIIIDFLKSKTPFFRLEEVYKWSNFYLESEEPARTLIRLYVVLLRSSLCTAKRHQNR